MEKRYPVRCRSDDHPKAGDLVAPVSGATVGRAAAIFRALGDGPRLGLLLRLLGGERCVSELVKAAGEKFSTVSQRLRVLGAEGLVARREQSHVYYSLADRHVADLVCNAVAHAAEPRKQGA